MIIFRKNADVLIWLCDKQFYIISHLVYDAPKSGKAKAQLLGNWDLLAHTGL